MAQFDPNDPLAWLEDDPTGGPVFGGPDPGAGGAAGSPAPPPVPTKDFGFGTYPLYDPITDKEAGDPEYNKRQKEFEGNTDWAWLEGELRKDASAKGVTYDRSDLAGIQRNSGYDAAHQGSGGQYGENILKFLEEAKKNYTQRQDPRDREGAGAGRTSGSSPTLRSVSSQNYSGPGSAGVTTGPVQQVGQDPFSTLITNTIGGILENGGLLDPERMALRQEASRSVLDRQRKGQLANNRGELADRNLLSVPGIAQGTDIGSILRTDERLAPAYANASRDVLINEQDLAEQRLQSALGLGTARQAMMGKLALDALGQNMEWNMFLARLGLDRDALLYEIQNGQMDNIIPLIQAFQNMTQTSSSGRV